jgi:hypothetical protein
MHEHFYYFLLDKDNRSYFQAADGSIQSQSMPRPLQNKPIGWQEIEMSFDVSGKYFSNMKALSVPMQYVLDGASILRWLLYRGKGYNEEVYVLICKYNSAFIDPDGKQGLYELEYKGQIDMLNNVLDEPGIGVTVNAKTGGLQSDLDNNADITYEFPLVGDQVLFDGVRLFDTYNYNSYSFDLDFGLWILPIVFLNNEGDSVGVISGTQQPEKIDLTGSHTVLEYLTETSPGNNIFETTSPIYIDSLKITFSYTVKEVGSIDSTIDLFLYYNITETTWDRIYLSQTLPLEASDIGETLTFSYDIDVNLFAGDKIFIGCNVKQPGFGNYIITISPVTSVSLSFNSQNTPSTASFLTPLALANLIVKKWNTAYSVQSNFLTAHSNLVQTSGQSLRGLPGAVIKKSFKEWWTDYDTEYCLALTIIGNVIYVEKRELRYSSTSNVTIFDLDAVIDLKIKPNAEPVIKTIKLGWPKQEYDERNGLKETNTEVEWATPAKSKGEIDLISDARGDPYGIEFLRGKLNNKDTTDAKSDNEAFIVNVTPQAQIPGTFGIEWILATKTIKLYDQAANISLFPAGKIFQTVSTDLESFNHFSFTVVSATVNGSDLDIVVVEIVPSVAAFFTGSVYVPYKLTRRVYDTYPQGIITPNIDGPGALFNIEEMTPKRRLLNWGSWFRSVFFQLPGEKLTFQTSNKNADLVTTLAGVTIAEKADTQVSQLAAPFFLNYKASFVSRVPLSFSKTMTNLNSAGNVRIVYNGFEIFLLPIGKMTAKPATNDAQEWELLISANNNLKTLEELSDEGLYISDGMNNTLRLSPLNPVHFIYYDKTLNSRYKYKDIYDDWEHLRNDQFAIQPGYVQKWEFDDTVKLQGIVNGLSTVELFLYKAIPAGKAGLFKWKEVTSVISVIVANPAVRSPFAIMEIEVMIGATIGSYGEGFYCYELRSNSVKLALSTIQHFAERHEGTYIFDYWNSYNKLNAYFTTYRPMIRVEAMWGTESGEGSSTDYQEENRLQVLDFDTYTDRVMLFGYPYGIPDWMQIKLNNILRLDRTDIEGTRITFPNDSKWEKSERSGVPFNAYSVRLRRSNNLLDFSVTDTGTQGERAMLASIDGEAFGQGGSIIVIEPE